MIATALKIQDATKSAVMDFSSMVLAKQIVESSSKEEMAEKIFQYSCHLSSLVATLVTNSCLTDEQLNDMLDSIKEFEKMGKDIENGN